MCGVVCCCVLFLLFHATRSLCGGPEEEEVPRAARPLDAPPAPRAPVESVVDSVGFSTPTPQPRLWFQHYYYCARLSVVRASACFWGKYVLTCVTVNGVLFCILCRGDGGVCVRARVCVRACVRLSYALLAFDW